MRRAITVENLSKCYRIGFDRSKLRRRTLADTIANLAAAPLRHLRQGAALGRTEDLWALKDVHLKVDRGEVVGVIGRNGAGKSTLLKILARVTMPTQGRAQMWGRVGSLLEVGTGFHPELSGRENVYLNGAILGMSRREIRRKFDEIAAFSGVEKFLDTPVKRYSSGMRVRLAFAVAAHLDPEILLIDEVLAVGDAEFQKRCLGKMQDVAREGRTVMFVSHNMSAVQNLCSRGIVLRGGRLEVDAPVDEAIRQYLSYLSDTAKDAFKHNPERRGNQAVHLTSACIRDEKGHPTEHLVAGKPATIDMTYANPGGAREIAMYFTIFNHLGVAAAHCNTVMTGELFRDVGQEGRLCCRLENVALPVGQYLIALSLHGDGVETDLIPNALVFDIASSVFYKSGRVPPMQVSTGLLDYSWNHEVAETASPTPTQACSS